MNPAARSCSANQSRRGRAVADSIEQWGIGEEARHWSAGAAIRYRSRRDLLECILHPQFSDIHVHKKQAIVKTFAYPTEVALYTFSPRWVVALVLVAGAALAQLALT